MGMGKAWARPEIVPAQADLGQSLVGFSGDNRTNRTPGKVCSTRAVFVAYDDIRPGYWNTTEDQDRNTDMLPSLGILVKSDGLVADVVMGGPAQKAGVIPGATITSVNGRQFTATVLREEVQGAAKTIDPIELTVRNGEYTSTRKVDYHGGERYPHLERRTGKADMLTEIVQPRAK